MIIFDLAQFLFSYFSRNGKEYNMDVFLKFSRLKKCFEFFFKITYFLFFYWRRKFGERKKGKLFCVTEKGLRSVPAVNS